MVIPLGNGSYRTLGNVNGYDFSNKKSVFSEIAKTDDFIKDILKMWSFVEIMVIDERLEYGLQNAKVTFSILRCLTFVKTLIGVANLIEPESY